MRIKSPRIVHQHERPWRWRLLLLLALLGAVGWQAYTWGVRQGGYDRERSTAEIAALKTALEEQQAAIRDLEAASVRYRRQAEIEQQASRELQQQLIAAEDERAALKSEVEMLRSLVSSDTGSLYIRNLVLRPGEQENQYTYRFTIVQVLEKVKTTRGKLVMKVSGKLDGKKKRLDYADFSGGEEKAVKLEFSNYKDVSGEMGFPQGFAPESMLIEFLPRNKELKKLSKTFVWPEYLQGME
ncbi:DUF6776 family protein [Thiolapillus sp.]